MVFEQRILLMDNTSTVLYRALNLLLFLYFKNDSVRTGIVELGAKTLELAFARKVGYAFFNFVKSR